MGFRNGYICECGEVIQTRADVDKHINTEGNERHVIHQVLCNTDVEYPIHLKSFRIEAVVNGVNKRKYYATVGKIRFPGTAIENPNHILAISEMQRTNSSYDIRVVDVTNDNVICEKLGLTNTTDEIINLGILSNLPKDEALFEFQIRSGTNNKRAYLSTITII